MLALLCAATLSRAAEFPLPPPGSNVIGTLRAITIANPETTLLDVARHFDLGYHEITGANPAVSEWLPKVGTKVIVPTQFILPPGPRVGIVINIPQRRLFYFPQKTPGRRAQVVTMPISIARPGWTTPLGTTRIVAKSRNPSWVVPESIRREHEQDGEPNFPEYFPPGPDNPMGMLALQTGFSMIFIHGTNRPWGVGMRTSHGCLHLYPEDAAYLFPRVPRGTPVRIIDEPYTVGIRDGIFYMSAAEEVDEYDDPRSRANRAAEAVFPFTGQIGYAGMDWSKLFAVMADARYLPVPISKGAPDPEQWLATASPEPYLFAPYDHTANNAMPPASEPRRIDAGDAAETRSDGGNRIVPQQAPGDGTDVPSAPLDVER